MNCLYEALAGVYIQARSKIAPIADDAVGTAEENLEACRAGLVAREAELERQADKLGRAAADKKRAGDVSGARFALLERKRSLGRMEKVRAGIALLDKQLDALQSSELDKQLMESLKLSSEAMRRSGIGQGLEEAEMVMNELDDRMREASEFTTVLATPLVGPAGEEEDALDVDEELGLIERERVARAGSVSLPAAPAGREPLAEAEREQGEAAVSRRLMNTMDF